MTMRSDATPPIRDASGASRDEQERTSGQATKRSAAAINHALVRGLHDCHWCSFR